MDKEWYENFFEAKEHEFEEYTTNRKPQCLVLGKTGAGKSSLINNILNKKVAEVGRSKPTTEGFIRYEEENIILYDSEGYTLGKTDLEQNLYNLEKFIEGGITGDNEFIHLAWYCVSVATNRIEEHDKKLINILLAKGIKTAIVLTRADASDITCNEMIAEAHDNFPDVEVFCTTTQKEVEPFLKNGINELFDWCIKNLPQALRLEFRAAADRKIDEKESEGNTQILIHSAISFLIGTAPIPASDAPFIITQQTVMVKKLARLWGVDSVLDLLITTGAQKILLSSAGKYLSTQLIKFAPIIGNLAGETVAAALTYGYGISLNLAFKKLNKDVLNRTVKDLESYFGKDFYQKLEQNISNALTSTSLLSIFSELVNKLKSKAK